MLKSIYWLLDGVKMTSKKKLIPEAEQYMKALYDDTIEETRNNYYPDTSIKDLIFAFNFIAKYCDCDNLVDAFIKGMKYQKRKVAKK